ncbi:MAG: hypothetical protein BGN88_12985, partial [Clostridiales bacterium 43-6]
MAVNYDIIVAGGGLTGVAAAIAAAREGARVLIVEQYGFLGGSACSSLVNPFMCYSVPNADGSTHLVNDGIFTELLKRLDELNGFHENKSTFNEEILKLVLDRMVCENNVTVLFHSTITDVDVDNGTLKSLTVSNRGGKTTLTANYFLDATGDADVAFRAGCSYQIGRNEDNMCQPMTMCFRIANIDTEHFWTNWSDANDKYQQQQKEGKIKNPREDLLLFRHMSPGVIHFNSTRIIKHNPVDEWDLSRAEMAAREQVFELFTFMKENAKGFENSTLIMSAPSIGVRESRMIEGEYKISVDDLLSCKVFED